MNFKKVFDFLRPRAWRIRPEANPIINDQVLARLTDVDPVYRALMDHAYAALETCSMTALDHKLSPDQRAYQCGRAAGVLGFIATVEDTIDRLRAEQSERSRLANEKFERDQAVKAAQEARKARRARFHVEQPPSGGS